MQQVTPVEVGLEPGGSVVATGTLAFLFTDIAGSTRLWELMPSAMTDALGRHDTILREAIESSSGTVVKTTGDGMMAVFPTAGAAVEATIDAQRALASVGWGETGPLHVRMAVNAGDAERRGDDYFGPTINRTARLMAVGNGGQVLLSSAAAALAAERLPTDASLRDLGEYRLRDLGRPERVYQLVHPDLQASFPALHALDDVAVRLPTLTTFVGRANELASVERLLSDEPVRLLTLTGPGGTGKTSLAIRAARDVSDRFRDGVMFVDVSMCRDADSLVLALGRAAGVGEIPDRPLREELVERLRDRETLLLLDNFEQVRAGAQVTTELLDACPTMKLFVTSREPLHVRVEHIYLVPPLDVPPATRGRVSADEVRGIEAIQLFVERARAVRPDFAITDDNAAAVAEICRRLDGLPLAIELAAARLQLFSPESLRDRLGQGLDLLRSSTRDLPERQQTLRGTIDWSYELLDPVEQRLFERLSVFEGADVSAIEAVSAAGDAAADPERGAAATVDCIGPLGSLIEKSLVRQLDVTDGEPRVVMLGTIREFATEQLDRRPEAAAVRRAHASYYAELASTMKDELIAGARDRTLMGIAAEAGNLRIAWRFWMAESDLGRLGSLAGSLLSLNEARGWYQDTVELTTDMLARLADATDAPVGKEIALRMTLARALLATRGFTPEVVDEYTKALDLFERGEILSGQHYSVLRGLANLYILRSEFDKAAKLAERILALADAEDDNGMRISGHLIVGSTQAFTGRLREGLAHLDTAIGLFKANPDLAQGSRVGQDPRVACLTTSAFSLWLLGFPDRAVERADAAIALSDQLGNPYTSAYARFHSGFLHLWRREPELVLDRAIRLQEIAEEYDFRVWSAIGSCLLGAAQTGLGRLEEGLARSREGMAAYHGIAAPPVFVPMLQFMDAGSRGRAGRPAEALPLVQAAIELVGGVASPALIVPEMNLLRGDLLRDTGDDQGALNAWTQALETARLIEARLPELRALTRLAGIAQGRERDQSMDALRAVYGGIAEGRDTADLQEASALLAQ
jgi:predicted ATPase/class 3 adenylate cyclase